MMRGATSSCLFIFICSMAALCESSTTVEDPVTPTVSSSSNTSSFTSSTLLSSLDSTSPGKSTFMTTTQSNMAIGSTIPDSRSSTESSNSTSAISSSTTDLMSSMSASSASVPIVTPTNLTSEAFSNANTVEAMTTALQSTVETTNFSVNQTNTLINVASSMINTTQPTSVTDDVTQGSTFIHTTIATTFNASSNLTTASVYTNITVPTTNGTTVVDASKTTVSSSPATKVTTTGTVTVPVNTTGLGTDVPHSSWSTQSQKTSTTHSTVQCQQSSCPPGSKCVEFFQSYTCRCPIGQAMQGDNCVTVKTFPGTLYLKMDFKSGMNDVHSEIFLETSRRIEEEMKKFFKNDPSYYQSIVRKLEKGSVKASVDNIFSLSSNVTEESVNQYIKAGIKNCSSCTAIKESDNYTSESICKRNVCDANTSKCKTDDGIVECTCLIGYYKFADSDRSCKACPNGLKLQNGSCVKCPFGYNGFNCDKSYLLALVVVSCVLGGILLLLLLALMGICLRLRSGAYSSSSGSHDYIMWPKSEMPKIPRATMHWDGNQLEMQENGSTSSLNDIHREGGRMPEKNDDLKTFKGKQQSRYTYLCQGQENPYYVSDEKKPEYL